MYPETLISSTQQSIRNLCSGYSYCISILDNIYVWHGCGSVAAERAAALRYAQGMAAKGTSVKELVEGQNDGDDEMFWMVVGDSESYAKADYWRWRSSVVPSDPRCWLVDIANSEAPVSDTPHDSRTLTLFRSVQFRPCLQRLYNKNRCTS